MNYNFSGKIVVLAGYHSTNGRSVAEREIADMRSEKSLDILVIPTEPDWKDNALRLADVLESGDVCVAIGGDETQNGAVNGIMEAGNNNLWLPRKAGNGNDTIFNIGRYGDSITKLLSSSTRFAFKPLHVVREYAGVSHSRYAASYVGLGKTAFVAADLDHITHRESAKGMGNLARMLHDGKVLHKHLFSKHALLPDFTITEHTNQGDNARTVLEYMMLNGPRMAKLTNANISLASEEYLRIMFDKKDSLAQHRYTLGLLMAELCLAKTPLHPLLSALGASEPISRITAPSQQIFTTRTRVPIHYDAGVKSGKNGNLDYVEPGTTLQIGIASESVTTLRSIN